MSSHLLAEPGANFVSSPFVRLEIMPKAVFFGGLAEAAFYEDYFAKVRIYVADVEAIVDLATLEAERCGMAAMDALHIAAASLGGADVFYTLERPGKPMYRTSLVRVAHISAA